MRKMSRERWARIKAAAKLLIAAALFAVTTTSALAGDQIGYVRAHAYGPLDLCRDDATRAKSDEIGRALGEEKLTWAQFRAQISEMEKSGELILVRSGTKVQVLATKPDPIWRTAAQVLVLEGEQKGKIGWMVAGKVGDCRSCDEWKAVAQ
jgi:hypothetical protein